MGSSFSSMFGYEPLNTQYTFLGLNYSGQSVTSRFGDNSEQYELFFIDCNGEYTYLTLTYNPSWKVNKVSIWSEKRKSKPVDMDYVPKKDSSIILPDLPKDGVLFFSCILFSFSETSLMVYLDLLQKQEFYIFRKFEQMGINDFQVVFQRTNSKAVYFVKIGFNCTKQIVNSDFSIKNKVDPLQVQDVMKKEALYYLKKRYGERVNCPDYNLNFKGVTEAEMEEPVEIDGKEGLKEPAKPF